MREQQDREYQESIENDRREREARLEQERLQRQEEEERRRLVEIEQEREIEEQRKKDNRLSQIRQYFDKSPEPTKMDPEGSAIRFKLPNGENFSRRFLKNEKVQV